MTLNPRCEDLKQGLRFGASGLGFSLGRLLAQRLVIHARMAPPHTRVCGWRHITRKATFVACVIELGETGSSLKPARCDDTTGNHPIWAYTLKSRTEQTGQAGTGAEGAGAKAPEHGRVPSKGRIKVF